MVFCATDWWGLAQGDARDMPRPRNLNLFPAVVDRLQQGVLNTLFLGRLMRNPKGFASNPAFQSGGKPVIDTSQPVLRRQQPGRDHGRHVHRGQPGLPACRARRDRDGLRRTVAPAEHRFRRLRPFLYASYPDQSLHPLILDLMQQLWDRGEADGYAEQMTAHPLPDTPSHQVLMQIAYGDHQVSMYAAALEARTIGASVYQPALDLSTNRGGTATCSTGSRRSSRSRSTGRRSRSGTAARATSRRRRWATWRRRKHHRRPSDPHPDPGRRPWLGTEVGFPAARRDDRDVCGGNPCRTVGLHALN